VKTRERDSCDKNDSGRLATKDLTQEGVCKTLLSRPDKGRGKSAHHWSEKEGMCTEKNSSIIWRGSRGGFQDHYKRTHRREGNGRNICTRDSRRGFEKEVYGGRWTQFGRITIGG